MCNDSVTVRFFALKSVNVAVYCNVLVETVRKDFVTVCFFFTKKSVDVTVDGNILVENEQRFRYSSLFYFNIGKCCS